MNTRFNFVKESHDEDVFCMCREGGENEINIMTKNPIFAKFEEPSPKMCSEVPEGLLEKVKKEEGCQKVLVLRYLS